MGRLLDAQVEFVNDMHMLDEEFVALLNRCMADMLDKKWQKDHKAK